MSNIKNNFFFINYTNIYVIYIKIKYTENGKRVSMFDIRFFSVKIVNNVKL